ncbi:thioredoxin family protein [Sulfurimonas sp.]|nr:thioredoxin family protein [Sulfurimonas sp.]
MKYFILMFSLISLLNADFDWPGDYDEALKIAKKEKKEIYLMIGSANCRFCEKFENVVLMDKDVYKNLTQDFVPLYLSKDIDDIPEGLKTSPIPRHYFLDENGKVIESMIGYRGQECFYNILEDIRELRKK